MSKHEGITKTRDGELAHPPIIKVSRLHLAKASRKSGPDGASVAADTLGDEPHLEAMTDEQFEDYKKDLKKAIARRMLSDVTRSVLSTRLKNVALETRVRGGENRAELEKARQEADQYFREA